MSINKLLDEIDEILFISGYRAGKWEPFRKNINYDAFGASRIEYITLQEPTISYMEKSRKQPLRREQPQYNDEYDVEMEDLGNDACVIEKTERMIKLLEKSGFPKELEELYWRKMESSGS